MNIPKFRAWDKVNKKMLEVNVIDFNFEKIRIINDNGHCISVDFKNIELMQSTGLKDKNGIEIFEGDIIFDEFYKKRGQIIFVNSAFFIKYDYTTEPVFKNYSDVEVIGNIYENPELLKEVENEEKLFSGR